jgi:formate dehydrogenase subunit delta
MSTINKLVLMANQIAANLANEDNPAAATAEHILLYWDPRMRANIVKASCSNLSTIAAEAVDLIQSGHR